MSTSKSYKNKKRNLRSIYAISLIIGFFIGIISSNLILSSQLENEIHLNIVYSSEKAKWMSVAYGDFLDYWKGEHPDQNVIIEMHPYGSSDSVISLLNGEIYPTIWSPASSIWIPFLNTKWIAAGNENNLVSINESIRIIYSPIVIATWEKFYQDHKINGFNDLRNLILSGNYNVKMAHTDPRLSNSGFMGTIMAVSAFSGVPSENLTLNNLTNETIQQDLKDFESSAVMYGKSTGFLSRYMKSGGPSTLDVALLYENLVTDISNTSAGGKVIAIYPEEGTLYSDHPFCILNADWITEEQRVVANAFLDFLQTEETIKTAIDTGFRPINSSIPLNPDIFNYEKNGVLQNINNVKELKTPEGEILLKIPDLWQLCKNTV